MNKADFIELFKWLLVVSYVSLWMSYLNLRDRVKDIEKTSRADWRNRWASPY